MQPTKNQNKQIFNHMISNFFEKPFFTLRELCFIQLKLLQKLPYYELTKNNYISINQICHCYLYFIDNDKKYLDYLIYTRSHYGIISYNNHDIRFRQIFQEFDDEFNKLVIRIRAEKNSSITQIDWDTYNQCFPNFSKKILQEYFESLKKMIKL